MCSSFEGRVPVILVELEQADYLKSILNALRAAQSIL
jgi:hypothetical protein